MSLLFLVRHGESYWNLEGRVQGQVHDVALTERGLQQARLAAESLSDSKATKIISSDLLRAAQTAQTIAGHLGLTVEYDELLREQFLGDMEGKLSKELTAQPVPEGKHINEVRWAGGESVLDVWQRMEAFYQKLSKQILVETSRIIVVSHGQALAVFLALACGLDHKQINWDSFKTGQVICLDLEAKQIIV